MNTALRLVTPDLPELAPAPLMRAMRLARECDRRESLLHRQGKGWFYLAGAGHEATAAIACAMHEDDYLFPHYRDRALVLARGVALDEMALAYFAKAESSSGGRQMPGHFSDASRRIVSFASPVGSQCLLAAGTAWALQLGGRGKSAVVCCLGEAALRQGEFYESYCFAVQESLPVVFVVEDNRYGISTPTLRMNPLRIGGLPLDRVMRCDGARVEEVFEAAAAALSRSRSGKGPTVLWVELERLESHAASDDQKAYRTREELEHSLRRDPLRAFEAETASLADSSIVSQVDEAYQRAFLAPGPEPAVDDRPADERIPATGLPDQEHWTIASAVNYKLRELLETDPRVVLFGEDIEDPKGGVFGFTKGLSTVFPTRVRNSPLAEATIAGVGAGLALAGMRPICELQFVDFAGPAFNQIANQITTMRWRSHGQWHCPVILLAPCGGYLPAGGPWHSQSNEVLFTHLPGLQVAIPSNPQDAAAFLELALASGAPTLLLLPKHLFRKKMRADQKPCLAFGQAAVRRGGRDVTVLAWGNCVELAVEAAGQLSADGIECEVLDVRSLVPCDWAAIQHSVKKTGRLVVVQEDSHQSSFGQSLISEAVGNPLVFDRLVCEPLLISRPTTHVPYNPALERAILPQAGSVSSRVRSWFSGARLRTRPQS